MRYVEIDAKKSTETLSMTKEQQDAFNQWKKAIGSLKSKKITPKVQEVIIDIFISNMGVDNTHKILKSMLENQKSSASELTEVNSFVAAIPVALFTFIDCATKAAMETGLFSSYPVAMGGVLVGGIGAAICGKLLVNAAKKALFPPKSKQQMQRDAIRRTKAYYDKKEKAHKYKTGPKGGKYYINEKGNKVYAD